jgi:hypothetical protein
LAAATVAATGVGAELADDAEIATIAATHARTAAGRRQRQDPARRAPRTDGRADMNFSSLHLPERLHRRGYP